VKRGSMLVALALTAALAGCGTGASGDDKGKKDAGPPPGGWPQPVNGQLTTQMCGLLTNADYAKYGHERLPSVSQKRVDGAPNAIDCMYMTSDDLSLALQPTAEAARVQYSQGLKDHKNRMREDDRPSILATNVVSGADESWFDFWTLGTANSKFKEYEVDARRGSLLVTITLSGLKGKNEKDPRTLLSGLAGLVLQRIPNVGRTDTGTTQKARFTVVGSGRARQIVYNDPTTAKTITLKNVRLPWHVDRPVVNTGQGQIIFNLNAVAGSPMGLVGCQISVEDQSVVQEPPRMGMTSCIETYTPTK
jgi:hypothetical protein